MKQIFSTHNIEQYETRIIHLESVQLFAKTADILNELSTWSLIPWFYQLQFLNENLKICIYLI